MVSLGVSTEDCPHHCPPVHSPVCGTDDQNYENVCRLLQSSCLRGQPELQLRHVGKCGVPEPCPLFCPGQLQGELPFCGDNLVTYPSMCHVQAEICRGTGPNYVREGDCQQLRTLIQKALNTGSPLSPDDVNCQRICTQIYQPVCGSDGQTYGNKCNLEKEKCIKHGDLEIVHDGKCTGPSPPMFAAVEAEVCPSGKCPHKYDPVCGTDGATYNNECKLQQHSCDSDKKVSLAYTGPCGTVEIRTEQEQNLTCAVCQRIFRPVCGSDGLTYANQCEMSAENCRQARPVPLLAKLGPCQSEELVIMDMTDEMETDCEPFKCPKILSPVCGNNGLRNMTFTNECLMRKEQCTSRLNVVQVSETACPESSQSDSDDGSGLTVSRSDGECPSLCSFEYAPVCGSDGRTYNNKCHLLVEACNKGSKLKIIHGGGCDEIKKVAEFGTSQLASRLNSEVHLTLSYIETEQKKFEYGTRYFLTVIVGPSNCKTEDVYKKENCPIVNQDTNLRCDIVVRDPLDSESLLMESEECEKAFNFDNICVGCPPAGSQEAEAARVVASYVVADLTSKAAHAHVIRNHLGLSKIKKFLKDSDGEGGFVYSIEVTVGETNCSLAQDFSATSCVLARRQSRLCSAKVHETQPKKVPRNVDMKRYEVKSTICKDSHDTINLEKPASITDQDVIEVAKALTTEIGQSFSSNMWLVTQVASANRIKAEEGINYALTVRFSESNCPLNVVRDSELETLYDSEVCEVQHTSDSKFCQILVNKKRITYRSLASPFKLTILDQICAEKKICPSDCEKQPLSPVCGSDGNVYPNQCYLEQAGCRRRNSDGQLIQAPDVVCAKSKLQDNIICAGCPEEGSQENEDVRAAADFANIALTGHFNNTRYFALDSITNVKTQVVAGTNFFLTIFVGETDCPVQQEFNKENCTINLEHDKNYQCDVVVYKPLQDISKGFILSHKNCNKVGVSQHVKDNCNLKCKKHYSPVCGSNGKTYLNECLLKMSACINQYSVKKMTDGRCELDSDQIETEANFATRKLSDKFKSSNKWELKNVVYGKKVPNGVRLGLNLQETDCPKSQRTSSPCPESQGPQRLCEATVFRARGSLRLAETQCGAGVVTFCDDCEDEDVLDIAKFAVSEITDDFDESNEWALQHVAKVQQQSVKDKYIVYNLSIHMTETSCARGVRSVYSDLCKLRPGAPTNYCEVTVLASLKSPAKRMSQKSCAGYNVSKYF